MSPPRLPVEPRDDLRQAADFLRLRFGYCLDEPVGALRKSVPVQDQKRPGPCSPRPHAGPQTQDQWSYPVTRAEISSYRPPAHLRALSVARRHLCLLPPMRWSFPQRCLDLGQLALTQPAEWGRHLHLGAVGIHQVRARGTPTRCDCRRGHGWRCSAQTWP